MNKNNAGSTFRMFSTIISGSFLHSVINFKVLVESNYNTCIITFISEVIGWLLGRSEDIRFSVICGEAYLKQKQIDEAVL